MERMDNPDEESRLLGVGSDMEQAAPKSLIASKRNAVVIISALAILLIFVTLSASGKQDELEKRFSAFDNLDSSVMVLRTTTPTAGRMIIRVFQSIYIYIFFNTFIFQKTATYQL